MVYNYPVIFKYDETEKVFNGYFPNLNGLSVSGEHFIEAMENAEESMINYIDKMKILRQCIEKPSLLEELFLKEGEFVNFVSYYRIPKNKMKLKEEVPFTKKYCSKCQNKILFNSNRYRNKENREIYCQNCLDTWSKGSDYELEEI